MALVISLDPSGSILDPLHYVILPKIKVVRTFSSVIVSIQVSINGLGLFYLESEYLLEATDLIISLFTSKLPLSFLLWESLEYLQLETGSATSVFHLSFKVFGYLTTLCWIRSVWESLCFHQIKLYIPSMMLLSLPYQNDITIMDFIT